MAPAWGAGLRQDRRTSRWLAVSSRSLNLSTSRFPFLKRGRDGRQRGRRKRKTELLVDGSHSTSDRVNIYSCIHEPGSRFEPPGFVLVSGPDLRSEVASV